MIYYCANCWNEIKADNKICPFCNAKQSELAKEPFTKRDAEPQVGSHIREPGLDLVIEQLI